MRTKVRVHVRDQVAQPQLEGPAVVAAVDPTLQHGNVPTFLLGEDPERPQPLAAEGWVGEHWVGSHHPNLRRRPGGVQQVWCATEVEWEQSQQDRSKCPLEHLVQEVAAIKINHSAPIELRRGQRSTIEAVSHNDKTK
jgi:hypothetical protein